MTKEEGFYYLTGTGFLSGGVWLDAGPAHGFMTLGLSLIVLSVIGSWGEDADG